MTDPSTRPASVGERAERLWAMGNYVLLILAPFSLWSLGALALVFAYLRRGRADPVSASHYRYQIRAFWIDAALLGLGALCLLGAAATGLGAVLAAWMMGGHSELGWATAGFILLWAVLWLSAFLWLLFGSIGGLMRLAAGAPMSQTAGP